MFRYPRIGLAKLIFSTLIFLITASPVFALTLTPPHPIATDYDSQKPSLWVHGSTVYMAWKAYTDGDQHILFQRSMDNGTTWNSKQTLALGVARPVIVSNGTTVFIIGVNQDTVPYGLVRGFFRRSTNNGHTFEPIQNIGFVGDIGQIKMILDGSNVYLAWVSDYAQNINFQKSPDNGATWNAPIVVATGQSANVSFSLAAGSANVYVSWSGPGGYLGTALFLIHSGDHGSHFDFPQLLCYCGGTRLATDGDALYIMTVSGPYSSRDDMVKISRSLDHGIMWQPDLNSTEARISNIPVHADAAYTLELLIRNHAIYAFWGDGIIRFRSSSDGIIWNPPLDEDEDTLSGNGGAYQAETAVSGSSVYIAWSDGSSNGDKLFRYSTDSGVNWNPPLREEPKNIGNSRSLDIAIGAAGSQVYVVWPSDGIVMRRNAILPRITSISPSSGSVGTLVIITGENFGVSQDTSTVTFDLTLAPVSSWSDTRIEVMVPPLIPGNYNVVVTTNGKTSSAVFFEISLLSPVEGHIHICDDINDPPDCPFSSDTWEFWQHMTGFHRPGGGIKGSDDTFAWDINLAPEPADKGKAIFAVAPGNIVRYGGIDVPGGCSGAVLIEHNANGDKWWSGYLHMQIDHSVREGLDVDNTTVVGTISNKACGNVGEIGNHLHFVVYAGKNIQGGLKSFDVGIVERPDTDAPFVKIKKPDGGTVKSGKKSTIKWESSDNVVIVSQDIYLSVDGGRTFPIVIALGLPGDIHTFEWFVSSSYQTTQGRIRVVARDGSGNEGKDSSDKNLTIK